MFANKLLIIANNLLDNKEMIINKPKTIQLFHQNKKNIPSPVNVEYQNQNINKYFDIIPNLNFYFPDYNLDFEYKRINYDIDDFFKLTNNLKIGGGYPRLLFFNFNYTYNINDHISIFNDIFEQSFSQKDFFGNNIFKMQLGMKYDTDHFYNKSYIKYSNSNFENYLLEKTPKKHMFKFYSACKFDYNNYRIKPVIRYKYFHYLELVKLLKKDALVFKARGVN